MSRTTRAPIFHGHCFYDWEEPFYGPRRDGLRYNLLQPGTVFKRLRRRRRKAKDRAALRAGREPERWRTSDRWDWL